jgi:hypothetical protein
MQKNGRDKLPVKKYAMEGNHWKEPLLILNDYRIVRARMEEKRSPQCLFPVMPTREILILGNVY